MLCTFTLILFSTVSLSPGYGEFIDNDTVWLTSKVESEYICWLFRYSDKTIPYTYKSKIPLRIIPGSREDMLVHEDGYIISYGLPLAVPDDFLRFSRGKDTDLGLDEVIYVHKNLLYERVSEVIAEDDDLTSYTVNIWNIDKQQINKINSTKVMRPWPINLIPQRSVFNLNQKYHLSIEQQLEIQNNDNKIETCLIRLVRVDDFHEIDCKTIRGEYLSFHKNTDSISILSFLNHEINVHRANINESGELLVNNTFSIPITGGCWNFYSNKLCEDSFLFLQEDERYHFMLNSILIGDSDNHSVTPQSIMSYTSHSPSFIINDECTKLIVIGDINILLYFRTNNGFEKIYECGLPLRN